MFLATIIFCSTLSAASCQLFFNTEELFMTEEACEANLVATIETLPLSNSNYFSAGCIRLPGEAA